MYQRIFLKSVFYILSLSLSFTLSFANDTANVKTHFDGKGWKLLVNAKDFYIKGVVWQYIPKNENYTYNLWDLPEPDIQKIIDYDFSLMQKVGINTVRSFTMLPPQWVEYINEKYHIKSIINPMMGRYGTTINGRYIEKPDYSDPQTRIALKNEVLKVIEKYKNVSGVLMFALGNESNYALDWKNFEIENLPKTEQKRKKAHYLYSLFNEIIQEGKKIDPHHPIAVVNGDTQYIDIISKYSENWDLFGINVYRGKSFTSLWKDVDEKLKLPLVFFEFGSDSYNIKSDKEDQISQARYLKSQWTDIYNNSYKNGYGNSLGAFVFEWRDEWWKNNFKDDLELHNRAATWENGAYSFDHISGQNNMNEEWFGINALGDINVDGVYTAQPRIAYEVLKEIWKINPYISDKRTNSNSIEAINLQNLISKKNSDTNQSHLSFLGGSFTLEALKKGYESFNPVQNQDKKSTIETAQSAFLNFRYDTKNLSSKLGINIIGEAAKSDFQYRYQDRVHKKNESNIEVYDIDISYKTKLMDINAFYHVPRYHWGYEGDLFGLMRETTDMEGEDIWDVKAPIGIELVGKDLFEGLKFVAGPEVYWGANPKAILKYQFGDKRQYTFMHAKDYGYRDGGTASSTDIRIKKTSQTTLGGKFNILNESIFEVAGLIASTEKINDKYDYRDNSKNHVAKIKLKDTLGFIAKLSFSPLNNAKAYLTYRYAGLVADAGQTLREDGTQLPYSQYGNKIEYETGMKFTYKDFVFFPRLFYRDNILDANPLINPSIHSAVLSKGITPRNLDHDPFAVLTNRKARAGELYITYDPTPSTHFYQWNNDIKENANFAFNLGVTFIDYLSATDSHLYYDKESDTNKVFLDGLSAKNVWLIKNRMVFNGSDKLSKTITNIEIAKQQTTGLSAEPIKYYELQAKTVLNLQNIFSFSFAKDKWGPYDFQRQFNITYPQQWEVGYLRLLDKALKEKESSRFGIKLFYRTLDASSSTQWTNNTQYNDYMYEIQAFYTYTFK